MNLRDKLMKKGMTKYLSRKIKFISVFAMVAVVFVNAYNYKEPLTPTSIIKYGFNPFAMFEYFFSNGLFSFSVPMFFAISGFLFFVKYKNTVQGYTHMIQKRAYSLLVPYIAWAIISGAAILILSNFEPFNTIPFIKENTVELQRCYVYLIKPPAFQFWFFRQLMLFAVLSPLIFVLIKYTKGFILIGFGALWFLGLDYIISSTGLLYFSIGAAFAIFGMADKVRKRGSITLTIVSCAVWLGLSVTLTLLAASKCENKLIMLTVYKLNELAGMVGLWFVFDHFVKLIRHKKGLLLASAHLFFVFALHEPLLHISYQTALIPDNSHSGHAILYLCLPVSIIALCIVISMMVRKLLKPVHSLLTGGRNH